MRQRFSKAIQQLIKDANFVVVSKKNPKPFKTWGFCFHYFMVVFF
jgi:hypothetical protein